MLRLLAARRVATTGHRRGIALILFPPYLLRDESQSTKEPEPLFRALLSNGAQRCASTYWSKNPQPPGVRFRTLLAGGAARIFFYRRVRPIQSDPAAKIAFASDHPSSRHRLSQGHRVLSRLPGDDSRCKTNAPEKASAEDGRASATDENAAAAPRRADKPAKTSKAADGK